ncbi:hypothetical protein D0499_03885 [Weissella soli]|nr:hypothetical protein [Weissella soli]
MLLMVFMKSEWLTYFFTFFIGVSITYFNIYFVSRLQSDVEPEYMGRVFSVVYIAAALLVPAADLLFGSFVPDLRENSLTLIGIGIVLLPFVLQHIERKEVD